MQNAAWRKALDSCADPQRARHYFEVLKSSSPGARLKKASNEQARILGALFSRSTASSELLAAHPDWLAISLEAELLE
jgi:hypothetical protein